MKVGGSGGFSSSGEISLSLFALDTTGNVVGVGGFSLSLIGMDTIGNVVAVGEFSLLGEEITWRSGVEMLSGNE